MRRRGLAVLLALAAAPASAHHGERHAEGLALAEPGAREMQRARPAAVPAQSRNAADAEEVAGFLNSAHAALRARRAAQAIDLLERAETRLLTRSTPAARAGVAVQQGPVGHIAAARRAAGAGDFAAATRETDAALGALERPRRRQPRT
jgi:hypothetical protein